MSKLTLQKTLVIVCGGTFVMSNQPNKGLDVAADEAITAVFRDLIDRLDSRYNVDLEYLFSLDSTDINPEHWSVLAKFISEKHNEYGSVVVVCGTNTLAYIASALAFALQGIEIPVILTGSQLPIFKPYSDGPNNFVNSLRVANLSLKGVFVVFGNKIIHGSRSKKVSESDLNAFESFNTDPVGTIGTHIRIKNSRLASSPVKQKFTPLWKFNSNIASLTLIPGTHPSLITSLIDNGYRGIILRSFGSGDVPEILFDGLKYAQEHEIPVINTTQCRGATLMGLNEVGRRALDYGLIQAFDMSMESMSTKLMWLIGQETPYSQMAARMHTSMTGEINIRDAIL